MGDTFNQNHSGSGHNVMNIGQQRFRLTPEELSYLTKTMEENVPASHWIDLKTMQRDHEIGDRLEAFLRGQGRRVERQSLIMLAMSEPLKTPITLINRGDHCEMILDSSVPCD